MYEVPAEHKPPTDRGEIVGSYCLWLLNALLVVGALLYLLLR